MARRKRATTVSGGPPLSALPNTTRSPRVRTALILVATLLAAAAGAWLVSTLLIGRAVAARLPRLPNPVTAPRLAAEAMAAADTAARRWPSAGATAELAMTYHASLSSSEAIKAYALAASRDPSDWRWPYYRGLLLEERGDQVGAQEAFSTVILLAPAHGLARFHLGEIAFKAGRLADAEAAYLVAQAATLTDAPAATDHLPPRRGIPLSAYASLGLARVQLDRGDRQGGSERLAAIVRAHPDFGTAHALLRRLGKGEADATLDDGRAYVPPSDPWLDTIVARSWHSDLLLKHAAIAGRTGATARREWLVRRALSASPQGLDVLLEAAATERAANRLSEAMDFLRQAEAVAPDDHHTLVEQGRTLSEMGRLAEAEAVLRRAIRVRDATAEYNLANVLDRMDRWDEAREHYDRAIAINPYHARAMNNLGIGFSRRGDPLRALPLYRRAIEVAPNVVDSYTNLSAALGALGRFPGALEATDAAIRLDPAAADAHSNRGIALAQLGRRDEARAAFETAVRLVPTHTDARRNLAAINRPY